jgi:proline dehydrogenase
MNDFKINFQDTATAFADKSDSELQEKFWLFKVMNFAPLVSLGTKLTGLCFFHPIADKRFGQANAFSAVLRRRND